MSPIPPAPAMLGIFAHFLLYMLCLRFLIRTWFLSQYGQLTLPPLCVLCVQVRWYISFWGCVVLKCSLRKARTQYLPFCACPTATLPVCISVVSRLVSRLRFRVTIACFVWRLRAFFLSVFTACVSLFLVGWGGFPLADVSLRLQFARMPLGCIASFPQNVRLSTPPSTVANYWFFISWLIH